MAARFIERKGCRVDRAWVDLGTAVVTVGFDLYREEEADGFGKERVFD